MLKVHRRFLYYPDIKYSKWDTNYLDTPLVALETTLQFLVDKTIYTFLFVKMKYRSVHFTIVFDNLLSKKNNYCVVYERVHCCFQ